MPSPSIVVERPIEERPSIGVDADAFRSAMRRFPTGVTIVTTWANGRPEGLTVNAFTAVSLAPPQVLICIDQTSRTHDRLLEAGAFAVNLLADGQESLAHRFAAKSLTAEERFRGVQIVPGPTPAPLIVGSLATLECRMSSAWPSADHTILVGDVLAVRLGAGGHPLTFVEGGFRQLAFGAREVQR